MITRPHNFVDLTGRRFGKLLVVTYGGKSASSGKTTWICACDCGEPTLATAYALKCGDTRSCGCLQREMTSVRHKKHGLSKHPIQAVWREMHKRCRDKSNEQYHLYGGRGIFVCERWGTFCNFAEDMLQTWRKGLTLERRNNFAGYTPANCIWADMKAQARNTRRNVTVQTPIGPMLLIEASEASGIDYSVLRYRHNAGWLPEDMFIAPRLGNKAYR